MSLAYQTATPETDWMAKLETAIAEHPAWQGRLTGVESEELLRGRPALSYLLRAGEERSHYYLSFVVASPADFKHQPFMIDFSNKGWIYRNYRVRQSSHLEEIIALIMHCESGQGIPVIKGETV